MTFTGDKVDRRKFKAYPLGYFHIDIAEVCTEQGKLYRLVTIDRTSKFAFTQLHEKATRQVAGDFLRALIQAAPYKIHTVMIDNGTHFTTPGNVCSATADIRIAIDAGELFHLADFITAYNFARRLKTLKGLTPYEFIRKTRTNEPQRLTVDPIHQTPGLNI